MSQTVYLNGEFLPLHQAQVSVLDRGFIFGDGAYEIIPVYSRHAFRLQQHLQRFAASLTALRLSNPYSNAQWAALVQTLIARQDEADQSIYLHVTRGVAPRDHAFPAGVSPTVFMMSNPLITPSAAQISQGVSCISASDIRWDRCDIKAIALLANVLLRQQAVDAGAVETILFRDDILTEGAASNIFAVRNGVILAPPKDQHMLPGITYDLVLELAAQHSVPVEIGYFASSVIRSADELWITSSTKEVLAIVTLDGQPIANGQPGPLFKRMLGWYQDYKQQVMRHG
ncbi:D-amino acid aminotransferase [Pseudomethylobacillus aquaticus]|uniref:D-amino acid aminotransferase n=1 Tax=Pseudomethylobacillus aquaticus TaxID=2676064 RepID=A0A3N0UU89_9PROT|nr:D-amino acid aminotransferase [Pseudomethylobacillus aquaticus]ROH84062.1 D-amino acid aminotransferase [Pseudomethylobacillus aquaticus]